MTRELTIGIAQVRAGRTKEFGIKQAEKIMNKIKKAEVIVFPEYLMLDPTGLPARIFLFTAEKIDGPWTKKFIEFAKKKSVYVITTLFEKIVDDRRVYNTAIVINPLGEIIGIYRKTHLFDAYGFHESKLFKPGPALPPVIEIAGIPSSLAICFDLRFPELFRAPAVKGAEIIYLPMAWYKGPMKEEMLKFLMQSRAHENTIYMVNSDLTGESFVGRSMIVHPLGHIMVDAGLDENYIEHTIDLDEIKYVRKILPLLELRRTDIYKL